MTSKKPSHTKHHPSARQGQNVFRVALMPDSVLKTRISTSCAECRRMKIRCLKNERVDQSNQTSDDRPQTGATFPCLTCIKRGCEAICPKGVLVLSNPTYASTNRLHNLHQSTVSQVQIQSRILEHQNSITGLIRRVHELESALQDAHAKVSDDTHPLLRSDTDISDLGIGLGDSNMHISRSYNSEKSKDNLISALEEFKEYRGKSSDNQPANESQDLAQSLKKIDEHQVQSRNEEEHDILTRAFGLLSIKDNGRSTYHAQNAGAWYYLIQSEETKPNSNMSPRNNNQTQYAGADFGPASSPNTATKLQSLSVILTPDILYASRMFPMGAIDDSDICSEILMRIQSYIPDQDEAMRLIDNYYAHSSWLYDPIPRPHFMAAIFRTVYPFYPLEPNHLPPKPHPPSYSLTLATFFIVLALGTHLDLDQPCGSPGTNVYYHLARAAIASDWAGTDNDKPENTVHSKTNSRPRMGPTTETGMPACLLEPGLDLVRILLLMSFYLHMSDARTGYSAAWALMGLATKLASGIGLHRDPTKWNLDPAESTLRQELFWELYTYDSLQSVPSGRPPSFLRITIDLKRPYEPLLEKNCSPSNMDTSIIVKDEILDVFKAWKHRFCFMKLVPTVEQAWGSRLPSYYTVLVLDRALREQLENIPVLLRLSPESGIPESGSHPGQNHSQFQNSYISLDEYDLDSGTKTCLTMQRYTSLFFTQIALILLHRPFFVEALNISDQPLTTKFAASVLAVYRSSCTLIARGMELYALEPRLSPRFWYFWAQIFSGFTCLGDLIVRSPNLNIALSALASMERACDLFEQIKGSNRAVGTLPTMIKLRDRARSAYNTFQAQLAGCFQGQDEGGNVFSSVRDAGPSENEILGPQISLVPKEEEDEISALVGETRLVDKRSGKSHTDCSSRSGSSPNVQFPSYSQHSLSQGSQSTSLPSSSSTPPTFLSASNPAITGSTPPAPRDFFMPTSEPWTQTSNEFRARSTPDMTSDPSFGFGVPWPMQTVSQEQPFYYSQLIDPPPRFRQLETNDIATQNVTRNDAAVDTSSNMNFFSPHNQDYGTGQIQLPSQSWTRSLSPDSGLGQQVSDFNLYGNGVTVQPRDTDIVFENFIAQALRVYTFGPDASNVSLNTVLARNMAMAPDQISNQNSEANLPLNLGLEDLGTPNAAFGTINSEALQTAPLLNDAPSSQFGLQLDADINWTLSNVSKARFFDTEAPSELYRSYMQDRGV